MTPQEKAKELLDKYNLIVYRGSVPLETYVESIKKCALLSVEEIISTCSFSDHKRKHFFEECNAFPDCNFTSYWQEFEQEIEKL